MKFSSSVVASGHVALASVNSQVITLYWGGNVKYPPEWYKFTLFESDPTLCKTHQIAVDCGRDLGVGNNKTPENKTKEARAKRRMRLTLKVLVHE